MPLYILLVERYKWSIKMYSFEKFKEALRKREEERYQALKKEIKQLQNKIEKMLTLFFESSASQARTSYTGLEMY